MVVNKGVARPLPVTVMEPARPPRQPLAKTVNVTVASVVPLELGKLISCGELLLAAQAQLACTRNAPLPPPTAKFCELGDRPNLHAAAVCVMFTGVLAIFSDPIRLTPKGFASTEKVTVPEPLEPLAVGAVMCSQVTE